MNKTNEDNIKKYKKKLIAVFLSTSDPMTYEELTYEMEGIDVPENFLDRTYFIQSYRRLWLNI